MVHMDSTGNLVYLSSLHMKVCTVAWCVMNVNFWCTQVVVEQNCVNKLLVSNNYATVSQSTYNYSSVC